MNSIFRKYRIMTILGLSFIVVGAISSFVLADNNPNFKININPGILSIDIVADRWADSFQKFDSINNPVFNFTPISASIDCRTGDNAAKMVLGSNMVVDRNVYVSGGYLYVSNPDAAHGGWSVSLAPTNGPESTWNSDNYATPLSFNQSDCSGVGAKGESIPGGRMYIDPTTATIANGKCIGLDCSIDGVSVSAPSHFEYGVSNSVTII